jgi:endonuclease G
LFIFLAFGNTFNKMASERATLVLGGAALGAISFAAYQKFTQKPNKPLPAVRPPPPPQQGQPARPLDTFEKAKTILPFGFPGK